MKTSAGILLYRFKDSSLEVLIAHPGGPFFARKDNGIWSIPKGLYTDDEEPFEAAKREYEEEIGSPTPDGKFIELGEIKRKDGKIIKAWAVEGDIDASKVKSNDFEMEWPPSSGQKRKFPEIDRATWATPEVAQLKLQPAQVVFVERLIQHLGLEPPAAPPEQAELF